MPEHTIVRTAKDAWHRPFATRRCWSVYRGCCAMGDSFVLLLGTKVREMMVSDESDTVVSR